MAITTTLISEDDSETAVFASSYCEDLSLTFRFRRDPSSPTSVISRVANYFHQIEVNDNLSRFQTASLCGKQ
jgi:hypothetical protein